MEDLVNGLINVALNRNENKQDNDEDYSISNPTEVHSRSTWAEVVSTGKDEDEEEEENEYVKKTNSYSSHLGTRKEENKGRNDDNWETVGNDKKQQQSNRRQPNEESEEMRNDEGWETVEHKKQHHSSGKQHKVQVDNWQSYKRPPSEQEYKNHVQQDADTDPTRDELYDLAKACNKLWELDSNRLTPGKAYEIDCGEGKKVYQQQDMASSCLFSWVANDVFNRATYGRFCCLLDNYNPNQGSKEVVTAQEKHEQVAFIEEISRTAPIRYLHKYLCKKGFVSESNEEFKKMMMSLWFDLHGRGGGHSCSSAFEHVFVGEIKNRENEVSGFHNWIQFYLEEAKGHVDYQGYIFPRRRGECPDSETQLLTVQFEWNGVLKSLSSTFIGVSPEFEIALYTLCYFVGGEDNHIYVGPYDVNIKCYRLGQDKIGSIFPIAES